MNKISPMTQIVNSMPDTGCEGCRSFCENNGAFVIHKYAKGEVVTFPKSKKHLNFLRSGSVRISSEKFGEYDCLEQNIFMLVDSVHYDVEVLEDCEMLSLNFISAIQVCEKMSIDDVENILGDYHYSFHSLHFNETITRFVDSVVWYIDKMIYCNHIHNAKQLELFVIWRLCYPIKDMLEFFYPVIYNKIDFRSLVRANCFQANSVEELATLCGYSLHNFKKVFSDNFQLSPYKWMLQQNAPLIKVKLLDKTVPIKVIAAEFGFTCQSHLNRYCKQYLGGTSAQIRHGKGGK